jgi:MraZ protein
VVSFRGSFRHSIDGKGRLALPKPFRRITGVKGDGREPFVVLTKGFNGCVSAYTPDEWARFEERMLSDPYTDQAARDFMLEIADYTMDAWVDTVGRILIPSIHMELGGFEKNREIRVLGLYDHFELWNVERFDRIRAKAEDTFEERAKRVFGRRP